MHVRVECSFPLESHDNPIANRLAVSHTFVSSMTSKMMK